MHHDSLNVLTEFRDSLFRKGPAMVLEFHLAFLDTAGARAHREEMKPAYFMGGGVVNSGGSMRRGVIDYDGFVSVFGDFAERLGLGMGEVGIFIFGVNKGERF